jgi:hypothetical protein
MTGTTPPPLHEGTPPPSSGSLWAGIGLAWLIVLAGHAITVGLASTLQATSALFILLPSPEIACVVAAIVLLIRGRTRTGLGIFLGLASIVAVALLLVAACFGLIGLGSMH